MKPLTIIAVEQSGDRKLRTKMGSAAKIEEDVDSSIQTSDRLCSLGRLVKLGLATPLSLGGTLGPVALRPHLSMSMPM